jgi:hypothetical protein
MSIKLQNSIDVILTTIGAVSGVVSTLDEVEQIARMFLLFVSIISGLLLILVNWNKGIIQLKQWLTK